MANLYVGSDGVIHSGNGNGVRGVISVNTANSSSSSDANSSYSLYYNNVCYVSEGRKVFYWIFSIVVGIGIGIGLYNLVGSSIFATYEAETTTQTVENWFLSLAPWVFAIGGCAGSILYGVSYAGNRNYDLGAFVLSALSAVGGIIALAIALAAICFVVILVMYIIGVVFGIMIIMAIIAGLCDC